MNLKEWEYKKDCASENKPTSIEKLPKEPSCAVPTCMNQAPDFILFKHRGKVHFCYNHIQDFWAKADPLYKLLLERMEEEKNDKQKQTKDSRKPPIDLSF